MTKYVQDNLPNFDEEMARISQRDIDREAAQMHLARQFARWTKYSQFSKDPKFKERCRITRFMICRMMGNVGR